MENLNSILNYTIDDFTLSGNLSYINEHGEILHQTPLKKLFNLRWYIQHLMDESENEFENPRSEENLMKQTNLNFIKYVICHKHSLTPEQLQRKPFMEIIKIGQEKLDTEEGGSNTDEEESTTSTQISKESVKYDTSTEDDKES